MMRSTQANQFSLKFVEGLESLPRGDKEALLAQMEALTAAQVLLDAGGKASHDIQKSVLSGTAKVAGKISKDAAEWLKNLDKTLDWDPATLRKRIEQISAELSSLSESDFYVRWRVGLADLGGTAAATPLKSVGKSILEESAAGVGLNPNEYHSPETLEAATVAKFMGELIADLLKRFDGATPGQVAAFEAALDSEIAKLSAADRETLREFLKTERLTSSAVTTLLKSAGGFGFAQALIAGQGFAPYMALTISMKALSVAAGTTFGFGAYTTATSALAAALGWWAFATVFVVTGAVAVGTLGSKMRSALSKATLIVGWVNGDPNRRSRSSGPSSSSMRA